MPRPLKRLLDPQALSEAEACELLAPIGFTDWKVAHQRLLGLCRDEPSRELLCICLPVLLGSLREAATPDHSVLNFERLILSVPDSLALLTYLAENPRAVEILVKLFVGSQFLTEILLRNPDYLRELSSNNRLSEFKSRKDFCDAARLAMNAETTLPAKLDALRRYQHWELLRIGACDNFGLLDFKSVTLQLSLLADGITQAALALLSSTLGVATDEFCVLAFGKLGGEELNYSSDIDLVFVCQSNAGQYWELGQRLIRALMDATGEGFLYRVDMRLRPWGKSGALVCTVDAYVEYLQTNAALWEQQALLKARPIAGQLKLGIDFLKRIEPILFDIPVESYRDNIRAMKDKIEAGLRKKGRLFGDVKSGQGSIRDIEFVTQFLQLTHGRSQRAVRSTNTLEGLIRLADFECILPGEYRRLTLAYVLFRTIEHALQLRHNKAEHSLPTDERELLSLAQRLDFLDAATFLNSYQQYRLDIRRIYARYIENAEPDADTDASSGSPLQRHLEVMEPSYANDFSANEIQRHGALLSRLSDETLIELEALAVANGRVELTICGFDQKGELAMICGLLFAYGFDIEHGNVFTAEHAMARGVGFQPANLLKIRQAGSLPHGESLTALTSAKRFVDVFVLKPPLHVGLPEVWSRYRADLIELMTLASTGHLREAQGRLASRVAGALRDVPVIATTLLPIDIEIDNEQSDRHSVLQIRADDTPGFLYELTNALSLVGFDIRRVIASSQEHRAIDTLFIVDPHGEKITDDLELARLRAAIVLIKHFTHLLPRSSNPENALLHFGEFVEQLFQKPDWGPALASLNRSDVLEALTQLLGVSDFLWDDFLRLQHDNLFPVIRDIESLQQRKSREQLRSQLEEDLSASGCSDGSPDGSPDAAMRSSEISDLRSQIGLRDDKQARRQRLNAFKDREMFRVDMRHIVGQVREFPEFAAELTDVAEVVTEAAYQLCFDELVKKHGRPLLDVVDEPSGSGEPQGARRGSNVAQDRRLAPCRSLNPVLSGSPDCPIENSIAVLALGKAGGRELGFASDIELMFVYAGSGKTTGPEVIAAADFFVKLVEDFTHTIAARRQGIFEIDLRLRPFGRSGPLAVSVAAFETYFSQAGAAYPYERQALVKLRAIAGDAALGSRVIVLRDQFVYSGQAFDLSAMRAMREKQLLKLDQPGTFNAKLGAGGLVDCEYLVQGLQISFGHEHPSLRTTNTAEAINALLAAGFLSSSEHAQLQSAYGFLRRIIDALRMVRGDARDLTVPAATSDEFASLARRLGSGGNVNSFQQEIDQTAERVLSLSRALAERMQ